MSSSVTVKIRRARAADAKHIAKFVRPDDERELWDSAHAKPLDTMLRGIHYSDEAMTGFVNGVPVCMWGVVQESFIGPIGTPWMVGTEMLDRHAKIFLRRCHKPLLELMNKYAMLQNYVDARNTRSIQWLKWLGFEVSPEPEPYGFSRLPFHKFKMTRRV